MIGRKNKGNKGKRDDKRYRAALAGRDIPVLTLDNKWHKLFTQMGSTPEIVRLTVKLNELLKQQGKLTNDVKDIHRLKKRLMGEIVASMDEIESDSPEVDRKMEENRRLITECNRKMGECREMDAALPKEIQEVNYKLMLATMEICYDRMKKNTDVIREIDEWLNKTRVELKKQVVRKQESETENFNLYSYMHDIFGSEVLEIFDMQYNPGERPPVKKG